jgi:bifunctional non-homologous end joining protein LigD
VPRSDSRAPLSKYRAKRRAAGTNEPMGRTPGAESAPAPGVARLFVVHKHSARRLHWDLRLELGGVLVSWAVPKGFSLDPADKHLAVHVEDHPLEYGDYEGVIPEGNYGAGPSIVWDRGRWVAAEPPEEGLQKGKLLFDLYGYKLRGRWTLVRTKRSGSGGAGNDWLLIKKPDAWSRPAAAASFDEASVVSGLTVEELPQARERARALRDELVQAGAKPKPVALGSVKPMLAEQGETPFSRRGWLFELKWDGFRVLAGREDGDVRLMYRRGNDASALFPEITKALAALPAQGWVLDGEVVVVDEEGHPRFQRLQQRAQIARQADVARAAVAHPATYYAFDLLAFEGVDLRGLPLHVRKAALRRILPARGPVRFTDHVEEQGEALWGEVVSRRLEGIVAKKADAPYRAGRSSEWMKFRAERTGDFVVVGMSPPEGGRVGFGALLLGAYSGNELVYVGRVGTGFNHRQLADLARRLLADQRPTPPCAGAAPGGSSTWVEPKLAVEVRFKDWTRDEMLREPVFLRLREDKPLTDCRLPETAHAEAEPPPPVEAVAAPEPREVRLTNLNKVFWPEEGLTKGDLVQFYRTIAPTILPYLKDRPVVLTRYPDGYLGKSFFQKNAPEFAPGWVRTERFWSEDSQRDIDMFVCDDEPTLVYLANSATIPLHIGAARVGRLAQPDWCLLDLDPKEAPFAHVVTIAKAIRDLCRELGLPAFAKTSGQSGLHILMPLGGQCTHDQSKTFAELLARTVAHELPEIATVERVIAARKGRVYVDFGQNGEGRLMAAPYCVRARPGAPVSTPLRWSEVSEGLDPTRFTMKTVPARLAHLKKDPLRDVLAPGPDLLPALEKLARRIRRMSGA